MGGDELGTIQLHTFVHCVIHSVSVFGSFVLYCLRSCIDKADGTAGSLQDLGRIHKVLNLGNNTKSRCMQVLMCFTLVWKLTVVIITIS